jgi:hypothetical protein
MWSPSLAGPFDAVILTQRQKARTRKEREILPRGAKKKDPDGIWEDFFTSGLALGRK